MPNTRLSSARKAIASLLETHDMESSPVDERNSNPSVSEDAMLLARGSETESDGPVSVVNDPNSYRDRDFVAPGMSGVKRRDPFAISYTRGYMREYMKKYREDNPRTDQ